MLPEEWGPGRLVLLLKKGDPLVPGNYRPINLTEVMYRVFEEAVLVHRAARWIDAIAPPTQSGFRPRRGTLDELLTLRMLIDGASARAEPLILTFLDLAKAFDSVSHDYVLYNLARFGMDRVSCLLVRRLMSEHSSVLGGGVSIDIKCGVLQGGISSPLLFVVGTLCTIARRVAAVHGVQVVLKDQFSRCPLIMQSLALLEYADDKVLVASSAAGAQGLLDEVDATSRVRREKYNAIRAAGHCHPHRRAKRARATTDCCCNRREDIEARTLGSRTRATCAIRFRLD
jgi:hypothetical protein